MDIHSLFQQDTVLFLDETVKTEVLESMADRAADLGRIVRKDAFLKAVLDRESIVSTGIGLNVAVPHAKLADIPDFFIVTAILKKGADWDAIDSEPVKAVFMIGGPLERQQNYLEILAKLTLLVKNRDRRNQLFQSQTAEEVVRIFENF